MLDLEDSVRIQVLDLVGSVRVQVQVLDLVGQCEGSGSGVRSCGAV